MPVTISSTTQRPVLPKTSPAVNTVSAPDSIAADSIATDSISTDSVERDSLHAAMVFAPVDTLHHSPPRSADGRQAVSWIMLALLILVVAVGLKFRRSTGYIVSLLHEVTTTRRRNNMFDNTVRESSFLLLLNVVTLLSGGLLLYMALKGGGAPDLSGALWCMGVAVVYGLFMYGCYNVWGRIFTDATMMHLWVRGHTATQGLLSFAFLPLALATVADTELASTLAWIAAGVFGASKLIFIFKGARIFLQGTASAVVFFYYLCSLEIVPLVLSYKAVLQYSPSVG